MIGSIKAEIYLMSRRVALWVLMGIWAALAAFFGYILPYISLRGADPGARADGGQTITDLLPQNLVSTIMGGYPFFGGVLVLILGVMTLGSEYGWGTLKTLFTQRPGRLQVFGAKMIALAVWLVPFALTSFATGAISSVIIAQLEDLPMTGPDAWLVIRGLAAAWLIMAVWAALGVLLGVVSRGTAMAIGLGILYGLVVEGLISALFDQISFLKPVIDVLLRANAYSLVAVLGSSTEAAQNNGPGAFSGPYVGGLQATVVLLIELAVFLGIAGALLKQRDVT